MRVSRLLTVIVGWVCTLRALGGANFPVAKIADTSTPIPNGVGNFVSFSEPTIAGPAIVGPDGNFYSTFFMATGTGGLQGIYKGSGVGTLSPALSRVADTTMPMPGLAGNFSNFSPVLGGAGSLATASSRVAFSATSSVNASQKGIYVSAPGIAPTLVVGSSNVNGHAVIALGDACSTGDFFSFRADGAIYGDTSTLLADSSTQVSGAAAGDTFATLGAPHVFEANVAGGGRSVGFRGSSSAGVKGVYVNQTPSFPGSSVLFRIADTNTPVPGGASNFTDFGDITGNSSSVYFRGISGAIEGIYRSAPLFSGLLLRLVDSTTVAPEAAGATFQSFGDPGANTLDSTGSTGPLFTADLSDGREGIYVASRTGASPQKIIDTHDLLDGKSISDLSISAVPYTSGRTIVFKAVFADGSQGIYSAVLVPEPGLGGICLVSILSLRRLRRTRSWFAG